MQTQPNSTKTFAGSDYDHDRDSQRLTNQYQIIFDLMKDGVPRSLAQIESATGFPQASISAQLRFCRRPRFGSHTVKKDYLGGGLYQYTLILNTNPQRKLF